MEILKKGPIFILGLSCGYLINSPYSFKLDSGTKRSIEFWKNIGPIYCQYRFIQFLNDDIKIMNDIEANIRYNNLHNKYTDDIKYITYRLRGFYLKSAQLMSVQVNLFLYLFLFIYIYIYIT